MLSAYIITAIGFLAQLFFSARIIIQWIMSEKAKKVVSPSLFWVFSLVGSFLLFIYGWLRNDFAIMLGQFITYYIYIWNLQEKNVWNKIPKLTRWFVALTPICGFAYIVLNWHILHSLWFKNEGISIWLLVYGSAGQVIFTLRFVYQYYYSKKQGESTLPIGFWLISLIGSLIIVTYGVFRLDIVLILGQLFGFLSYIRNLFIWKKQKKQKLVSA